MAMDMDLVDFSNRLIDEVRSFKRIYDNTAFKHCKQDWKTVSENLGVNETVCRNRWRNLKCDYFRNVKKSWTKGPRSWQYMDKMSFILPYGKPEFMSGNNENGTDNENSNSSNVDEIEINSEVKMENIFTNNVSYPKSDDDQDETTTIPNRSSTSTLCGNEETPEPNRKRNVTDNGKTEQRHVKRSRNYKNRQSSACQTSKIGSSDVKSPLERFFSSFALQLQHLNKSQQLKLQLKCIQAALDIENERLSLSSSGSSSEDWF